VNKESFWIGAKGGLLDEKHIKGMGIAVWMFLYFVRGQTGLNKFGEGIFYYGRPITLAKISEELKGTPIRTVRKWITHLKASGYIRAEDHGRIGSTFWVAKGKEKRKNSPKETEPVAAQRPKRDDQEAPHSPQKDVQTVPQRPNFAEEQNTKSPQPTQPNEFSAISFEATPIGPSYHNKGEKVGTTKNHRTDDAIFYSPLEQARQKLLKTQPPEERPFVEAGLDVIEHRVLERGSKPRTPSFYITAYENLKASEKEWSLIQWFVENPGSGNRWKAVNALIRRAEVESERSGRSVDDCFHDLRMNPRWHEEIRAGAAH
jgi:hypothetical protein